MGLRRSRGLTRNSASRLNTVKSRFDLLSERQTTRLSHHSNIELEQAILQYIAIHNAKSPLYPCSYSKHKDYIVDNSV
jgi:hypothetical protein